MTKFDFANVVEIEINSACNFSCSYCPNSVDVRKETGDMDPKLFFKIISDLKSICYNGKLAFDFYNEPTLAKNFNLFITHAKKELPKVFIEIYSNGTSLNTLKKINEIVTLGVDKVIITKHEEAKQLPFEDIFKGLEPNLKKYFSFRKHDELILSNRGGSLPAIYEGQTINAPCSIPSLIMTITVEGNVLPCFEDYKQTLEMGNLTTHSIEEVWNDKKYEEFRNDLLNNKREKYDICKSCNRISESMKDKNLKKIENHLLGDEEIDAIANLLKTGNLYRYQEKESYCEKFEAEFSRSFKHSHSLLVTSGTNALLASLMAAGVGPGDEVIIPAYTFVATATAVISAGAIPIIANIDENLGIDPKDIKSKINERTKAIIAVHMDGLSCKIDEIQKLSIDSSIILIEDCCQALGGQFGNKYLGTFGDFGCYSLNKDKVLTAGEGGIVSCKSKEHFEKLLCISDAGYPYGEFETRGISSVKPFVGLSMRVSEITGVMMLAQFKKLPEIAKLHRTRKEVLVNGLEGSKHFEIIKSESPDGDCSVKVHLRFKSAESCQLIGKLLRDHKVLAYPPFIRRAHVAWKWMHMFGEHADIDPRRNPYNLTDKKYTYSKVHMLNSIDIMMKVLIIDITVGDDLSELEQMAKKIMLLSEGI
jgi:8-amino-3,8-dideoxy-alpha-D-manno-octulosonate transaminase